MPGGLPASYGDLVGTVPDVVASTTATADIAWMTASLDADGNGVDEPQAPMMIPIETTGIDPTFAAFIPEPERQLVQNLRPGEGILSESEANLRGLGPGATLLFRGGEQIDVIGTLPDALMGDYELLVTRDTARLLGVTHERYVLFHVRPGSDLTPTDLIPAFRDLLPADTPYPAVEVRAPGETAFLRANDRAITPIALKRKFGEFTARPDPHRCDPTRHRSHVDQRQHPVGDAAAARHDHLSHEDPVLVEAGDARLDRRRFERRDHRCRRVLRPDCLARRPERAAHRGRVGSRRSCSTPPDNLPGDRPTQPKDLVQEMYRWGYGWGGNDAYPQGALFRYRKPPTAQD